ncbi:MAG TPA: hypothetical protein VFB54_07425, partial [Burkholderiales bacterium]|nr:hypothetical protein [Burkholderiales bacterium]
AAGLPQRPIDEGWTIGTGDSHGSGGAFSGVPPLARSPATYNCGVQDDFEKTQPGIASQPTRPPVPERYVGLWQRLILQRDSVPADVASNVFWLQTRGWHADVRIPAARPDFSQVRGLSDCSRDQLLWLAQQEGFAGVTEVEGEVCTWLRHTDFRPPTRSRGIGRMVFIDGDMIVETGLETRYLEIWERVPGSTGLSVALERVDAQGRPLDALERIVVAGEYMMHIRSRQCGPLAPAESLVELIEREQCDDERLRALVDFEVSFARQTPTGWRIQLSTLPFLEGTSIATSEALPAPSSDGFVVIPGSPSTRWKVREWVDG